MICRCVENNSPLCVGHTRVPGFHKPIFSYQIKKKGQGISPGLSVRLDSDAVPSLGADIAGALMGIGSFQDIVRQEPYPVAGKAREVLERLYRGITSFRLLFWGSRSRSEVVATFLAVLELCRAHVLRLSGSETDCTVCQEGELPEELTL